MEEVQQLGRDDAMRLVGHRDGLVSALLQVRRQITGIKYRFEHTPKWHVKKLALRDAMLAPLLEAERWLVEKLQDDRAAIKGQTSLSDRLSTQEGGR